jgi:starch phosphorylase
MARGNGKPQAERAGGGVEALKRAYRRKLYNLLGRFPAVATLNDKYLALAYAVRDLLMQRAIGTGQTYYKEQSRTVCYLSAEFLLGPHLGNNLLALGITEDARRAMAEEGESLDAILEAEEEPGLGNGGLGRLAACYMDSLATLELPAIGYGIRYEFGIFDQAIRDGWQVELTDKWLAKGNPWEIPRPEIAFDVRLGGHTAGTWTVDGRYRVEWIPERVVKGIAHDTYVPGYGVHTANLLRLFKAEATESFDFQAFNQGDYYGAVEEKVGSENLTKVLYPNDEPMQGKRLRLEQQYFFVTCALQDMIRIHKQTTTGLENLHAKYVVQLNDTHPAVAVAELMRLLVDENDLPWETAWEITRRTFAYTNHTLLPEALERWPVGLFGAVLPRHLEIVYEINRRFLEDVRARHPDDEALVRSVSLIDEQGERSVRMANLACVGSFAVNGVSALHSRLLISDVLADFHRLSPEKFTNVTNGVTPRRFLGLCNPGLTALVTEAIGDGWLSDLSRLAQLVPLAEDPTFRARWRKVKLAAKKALAEDLARRAGVQVEPDTLFDVQVKRIHEYKRQHLNVLHVIALYNRIRRNPTAPVPARTVILGGKAAPGYRMAKLIIKLVHAVAEVVNHDPVASGKLRVAFFPDYNVKHAQRIFPAADLSEQISTAGKEASGTGNMKFALNGAVTIGTLDGANVEIREAVGGENFFLFGLTAEQVEASRRAGYRPRYHYDRHPDLREALDQLSSGFFSHGDRGLFAPLVESLLSYDPWLVLADFPAYVEAQREVERAWRDTERWTRMSILNVARSGFFSSDRAIAQYAKEIWCVQPVPVSLAGTEPP